MRWRDNVALKVFYGCDGALLDVRQIENPLLRVSALLAIVSFCAARDAA